MKHLAVLVLCSFAVTAFARTPSYALVIGNNSPPQSRGEPLPTLRYADDDAARYTRFFEQFAAQTRVLTVLDAESQRRFPEVAAQARPPTVAELKRAVSELAARIQADTANGLEPVVYFAFSGHGAQNAEGAWFLTLLDGELTRQQLYDEVITRLEPAAVHLFIDACHAESIVGGRGSREVDVPLAAVQAGEAKSAFEARIPERFPRIGALLATTVDQEAHEWSRIESGVFTHELLSGLSGAADVNGDGVIEYSEVEAFIAAANRDLRDPRAAPRVVSLPPRVNVHAPLLVLAHLKNAARLTGPFDLGHFYIEAENGQRLLDAHLTSDPAAVVMVPAGRVFVIAAHGEAELNLKAGESRSVDSFRLAPSSDTARGSLGASLTRALFQSPFGATYYLGYVDSRGEPPVHFTTLGVEQVSPRTSPAATVAFVSAGALVVGSVVCAALAATAQADYAKTNLQRPAAEARDREVGFAVGAGVSGAAGIAMGVVGWRLLTPTTIALSLSAGGASLALSGRW